jgi:hypothetical protein
LWYRKAIPENTGFLKFFVILGIIGLVALTAGVAFLYEARISLYDVEVIAIVRLIFMVKLTK